MPKSDVRKTTLDFEGIKALIPQRFPFIMLDRVTELVAGERIVAQKYLSGNEWFYQGHFPSRAITPGAMILEAMAQASIILIRRSLGESDTRVTYLLGSAKVRFLAPVFPGSQMSIEVTPVKLTSRGGIVQVRIAVDGTEVATGELGLGTRQDSGW